MTIKELELNDTLIQRSREALNSAAARQMEVFGGASEETRIVYESDDFSVSTSGSNSRLGIRTLQDHKPGFVSTNSTSPKSIQSAVKEAYSIGQLSPPSEHYDFAKPETRHSQAQPFIHESDELINLSESEIFEFTEEIISRATADPRVRLDRVELALVRDARSIVNSNGIELSMRRAYINWSAMGMARDGDQVTSFDYDGGVAFDKSQISSRIQSSMDRFSTSVLASLNPGQGESYKGPVLLHPALVRQFVLGTVSSNANGKSQVDGTSPWKDQMGELVAMAGLTVYEDPLDTSRPETYNPFDREGHFTSRHELVAAGRLNFVGHNIYSASRAGVAATGNSAGGSSGTPGVGFFNVKLEFDDSIEKQELNSLYGRLNKGLLIKRFSGNADPSSGHFSGVAKNSYWIENGEVRPVKEVMVSGNLFDVLKNVVAATDREFEIMGGARAPYLLVDGISVTAGQ
ncbi:MAG: TldD/PmbA family protein [Leptospiraceae bacterium]